MFKLVEDKELVGYRIRKENRSEVPIELRGLFTSKIKAEKAIKAYITKYEKEKEKLLKEAEEENKKLKEAAATKPKTTRARRTTTKK